MKLLIYCKSYFRWRHNQSLHKNKPYNWYRVRFETAKLTKDTDTYLYHRWNGFEILFLKYSILGLPFKRVSRLKRLILILRNCKQWTWSVLRLSIWIWKYQKLVKNSYLDRYICYIFLRNIYYIWSYYCKTAT